ncbi:hypothetical protein DU19_0214 [Chlamydia muridarum]|uniref:Uncharacterized protein n=1 Tax=Chlamydia muridarum (strain MoPn / Nigg) TaxID=243161 RepID=Q9PLB9_CHLMU|nr:hypothetical protein TC_0188 [Chlamydia muridarum str. Nigg]KDU80248.1 hypothetical protein DU17_0214 [Chlamydia muridarum]KDU81185.1 hypothetical protein DU18_0215 [Chlamydia muridarum]KDU82753.1 hypothetical protein DU19_0214 [Chlamydia muridarum]KDU83137.1 hypothetical protein DU20_0214 [Chlamydia muridarum]
MLHTPAPYKSCAVVSLVQKYLIFFDSKNLSTLCKGFFRKEFFPLSAK